jgi:tetratricopeptide (TPR) repeat protein
MEKLHFLIRTLSKPQRKILKVHLKYLSVRKDSETQLMKLADILLTCGSTPPTVEECSLLIYGKMNYASLQKIKSRLLQRVKSLLVFDVGMEKRGSDREDIDRYGIAIRWETTLFQILYNRTGNSPVLRSTMNEIIRLCKEYEYYPTLVEILNYKKWLTGYRQGEKVMAQLNEEVNLYKRCNDTLTKAKDYYLLAIVRSNFSTKDDMLAFQNFLRDAIAELNEESAGLTSPFIVYYIKHLEIMYYEAGKNFVVTREVCLELINIVKKNKSIYSKQRLAVVYGSIAVCDIKLGDYDLAVENALSAQRFSLRNTENYFAALEYEFVARFYQREIEKCKLVCAQLVKSAKKEMGEFRYAKYLFFQANVFYLQGRYKEGLALLNFKLELSKDKLGWDLSIRILRIQLLLEMGRMDEATTQFESLSKHASRSTSEEELKPRDKLILRILRMLNHEGYSGTRIRYKIEQNYKMLTEDKSCSWEPISSEMIPFDQWLATHYKINSHHTPAEAV